MQIQSFSVIHQFTFPPSVFRLLSKFSVNHVFANARVCAMWPLQPVLNFRGLRLVHAQIARRCRQSAFPLPSTQFLMVLSPIAESSLLSISKWRRNFPGLELMLSPPVRHFHQFAFLVV
jgi:hypothetical protein